MDFSPTLQEEEAGVSVFLTQNHHLDLGVALLPVNSSTAAFPGTNSSTFNDTSALVPQFRFRGISTAVVPDPIIMPVPQEWVGQKIRLEIKASNMTHYTLSAGPANALSKSQSIVEVSNAAVSWGFTGKPYCPGVWASDHELTFN